MRVFFQEELVDQVSFQSRGTEKCNSQPGTTVETEKLSPSWFLNSVSKLRNAPTVSCDALHAHIDTAYIHSMLE